MVGRVTTPEAPEEEVQKTPEGPPLVLTLTGSFNTGSSKCRVRAGGGAVTSRDLNTGSATKLALAKSATSKSSRVLRAEEEEEEELEQFSRFTPRERRTGGRVNSRVSLFELGFVLLLLEDMLGLEGREGRKG